MAIPVHWASVYRYLETLAVTDVQTIIDDLYAELVTGLGWTCTLGGIGLTPTTYRSPTRADGLFFTVKCTRISATRIAYVVTDYVGMLVNPNTTDSRQDIDAGGTSVQYYTGPLHVGVNSARATPEFFGCGLADQTPNDIRLPRPTFWASKGPRNTTGTLDTARYWSSVWLLEVGAVAYTAAADHGVTRGSAASLRHLSIAGAYLFSSFELTDNEGYWLGRVYQTVLVDSGFAFGAEVVVPIDAAVTGVFRVVGEITTAAQRLAFRKS